MQLMNSVQQAAATSAAMAAADSSSTPGSTSGSAIKPDALAGTDTFLKLLVAQIKNQNPTQPTDPNAPDPQEQANANEDLSGDDGDAVAAA